MIRYLFNLLLQRTKNHYDYDVRYMQYILQADIAAFLKFMGFQLMSSHAGNVPTGVLYAARIRAIIWHDCGPCTQLVVDMALEAKVNPELVHSIIEGDLNVLPDDIALVVRFTELVLAHDIEADELREELLALWGAQGLITIAYAISSYGVYPALKYTLGFGKTCSRIKINDAMLSPKRELQPTMGLDNVS